MSWLCHVDDPCKINTICTSIAQFFQKSQILLINQIIQYLTYIDCNGSLLFMVEQHRNEKAKQICLGLLRDYV